MESCWAEDENVRPRFEEVVVALDEMRATDGCVRYGSSRCVSRVMAASLMRSADWQRCGTNHPYFNWITSAPRRSNIGEKSGCCTGKLHRDRQPLVTHSCCP
jgi:hypothetical protein